MAMVPADETLPLKRTFGSGGPADDATTYDRAWDGSLSTYYDAAAASDAWTAAELPVQYTVTGIAYAPCGGQENRCSGGRFQGANSETGPWKDLHCITSTPPTGELTQVTVEDPGAFTFVRYLGPPLSHCSIASIVLSGFSGGPPPHLHTDLLVWKISSYICRRK